MNKPRLEGRTNTHIENEPKQIPAGSTDAAASSSDHMATGLLAHGKFSSEHDITEFVQDTNDIQPGDFADFIPDGPSVDIDAIRARQDCQSYGRSSEHGRRRDTGQPICQLHPTDSKSIFLGHVWAGSNGGCCPWATPIA